MALEASSRSSSGGSNSADRHGAMTEVMVLKTGPARIYYNTSYDAVMSVCSGVIADETEPKR